MNLILMNDFLNFNLNIISIILFFQSNGSFELLLQDHPVIGLYYKAHFSFICYLFWVLMMKVELHDFSAFFMFFQSIFCDV